MWLDALWEEIDAARAGEIARDVDELEDALLRRASARRWSIVFAGEPESYPAAVQLLEPSDPSVAGYAQAVGGVTVVCGEADTLAPNNGALDPAVRSLLHRGRHYALSLFAAARRPAEVARDVSSQADLLVFFQTHEPRDLQWIRAVAGDEVADRTAGLAPFGHILYRPDGSFKVIAP